MKRKDLLKKFYANGWRIEREGGNHTVLTDGRRFEYLPRHTEIKEPMAKALIKKHGLNQEV